MAGKSELVTNTDARDGLPVVRRRIVCAADAGVIQRRAAGPKLQIPTVSLGSDVKRAAALQAAIVHVEAILGLE